MGTAGELYERPRSRFVADFIGETNFVEVTVSAFGEDWLRVGSPSLPEFRITGQRELADAGSIVLSIRPEKIVFVDHSGAMPCTVKATVKEIVYMGDVDKYYTRLPSGEVLIVKQHNRKGVQRPQKGANVIIGWHPENCVGLSP